MPALTNSPALDVLIGLAFLYWLLSIVASSVRELIATILSSRAKNLEEAIRNLLAGPGTTGKNLTTRLYAHWRIQSLAPPKKRLGHRGPAYIPAAAFTQALLETLAPATAEKPDASAEDALKEAEESGAGHLSAQVKTALSGEGADLDELEESIEEIFDDAMERASGWYARNTQYFVWVTAAIITIGLNVNSFHVGSRLWKDDVLRAAVVAKAQEAVKQPSDAEEADDGAAAAAAAGTGPCPPDDAAEGDAPGDCTDALEEVAESIDEVQQLELPIGWADSNTPHTRWEKVGWVFGWLATIAAVGLGAPFWFDTLGKLARLRGSGPRPEDEGQAKREQRKKRRRRRKRQRGQSPSSPA